MRNLNTYATAYASVFENMLLISPALLAMVVAMDRWYDAFNWTTVMMTTMTQVVIFILGHSGMKHSLALYLIWPPCYLQSVLTPIGWSLESDDHELHHTHVVHNFSLNFRFLDLWHGTYRAIDSTS